MVTGEYESPSPTPFRNRFASAALVSQERNASTDSVSNRGPSPLAEKSTGPLSPNDDHNAHGNARDDDESYESFGNVRVVAFKKN